MGLGNRWHSVEEALNNGLYKRKGRVILHLLITGNRKWWEALIKADCLTSPAVTLAADLPAERMISAL